MLGLMRGLHSRKASRFVIFVAVAALACAVYLALETAAWASPIFGSARCLDAAGRDALFAQRNHRHSLHPLFLETAATLARGFEPVNGLLLFGPTTAFLYAAIHEVWPLRRD